MINFATLLTALASLVAAIAWPFTAFCVIWIFRRELRLAIAKIPHLIDRMKSVKIFDIQAELAQVADQAVSGEDPKGAISASEIIVADRIKEEVTEVGEQAIAAKLDRLCIEYDNIRREMPASIQRTRLMTQVLVQMRMLGPAMSKYISTYMSSGSAGSRLAAVAMMQIQPDKADLEWLVRRFREEAPFVFYHAALALQNVANNLPTRSAAAKEAATRALEAVKGFTGGPPDEETIFVLTALAQGADSGRYV